MVRGLKKGRRSRKLFLKRVLIQDENFTGTVGFAGTVEGRRGQSNFEELKVDVWVEWPPEGQALCSQYGKAYRIYDHREERQWRHLDTMQFQTILHCRIARINCPEHGVKSIDIPWADKNSRFTALFERLAIYVLLGCQTPRRRRGMRPSGTRCI